MRRSYLPNASPVVARNAVSVRVWTNSLLSRGVGSMNQPTPLASSMRMVPPLGRPKESKEVIWASASCPVGRSAICRAMLKLGSKSDCHRLSGLSLYRTYPTNNICATKLKLIENGKRKIKVFKHILRKEVGIFTIVG